jgi:hypothetical protein
VPRPSLVVTNDLEVAIAADPKSANFQQSSRGENRTAHQHFSCAKCDTVLWFKISVNKPLAVDVAQPLRNVQKYCQDGTPVNIRAGSLRAVSNLGGLFNVAIQNSSPPFRCFRRRQEQLRRDLRSCERIRQLFPSVEAIFEGFQAVLHINEVITVCILQPAVSEDLHYVLGLAS